MNPVKAGIVKTEDKYKFSSYNDYINKTGFVNKPIVNFVFSSSNNYIQKFQSIDYKDLNIDNEKGNPNKFLENFLSKEKINLEQLKKDKAAIKRFITYLNTSEYKFSKQDIAKVLSIGKTTLYRRLNSGTPNDCP